MTTNYIEKFWRPATSADVARVMAGEVVEARFRDHVKEEWGNSTLMGWQGHLPYKWIKATGGPYCECQVYSPPQYWLDKPEPGEGYRLLAKFPDEPREIKDDVFIDGKWIPARWDDGKQQEGVWYRRRIEQPKPDPKYAVGQRVRIIGPVCGEGPIYNWTKDMDQYIGAVGTVRLKPTQDPEGTFYAVGEIVGWSFREDYLQPFVEPKHYVLQVGDTVSTPSGRQAIATELGIEVS